MPCPYLFAITTIPVEISLADVHNESFTGELLEA
jgi:hypothetical protein